MTALEMWIDGVRATHIDAADRGLQYGDGLFETITCVDGAPRWLDRHLARLRAGCARLSIAMPDTALLTTEIGRCAAADSGRAIVKLIVTRGQGAVRGYGFDGSESPTRVVARYPWPVSPSAPLTAGLASLRCADQPALAGIKHLNRLEQVLARREAIDSGLGEVLLRAPDGRLVGGSMTNVFLVRDGALSTPRIERSGIAGVMRSLVLDVAPRRGIEVRQRDIEADELDRCDELLLTNVRIGVQPVAAWAGRPLDARVATLLAEAIGQASLEGVVHA